MILPPGKFYDCVDRDMAAIEGTFVGTNWTAAGAWRARDHGALHIAAVLCDDQYIGFMAWNYDQCDQGKVFDVAGMKFTAGHWLIDFWPHLRELARMQGCQVMRAMSARPLNRIPGCSLLPVATMFAEIL